MNFFRFIGWHKSFAKNEDVKIECYCSDSNGFYITKRQASAVTSIIIILFTLALIMGYLCGQRNVIQEFTSKVINDSFADQVNYSMYSMYGENSVSDEEEAEESEENQKSDELLKKSAQEDQPPKIISKPQLDQIAPKVSATNGQKHYAQLVGFGSRKNAEQFVNKLQKKGYTIHVEPRKSKTSKGKVITWYQAVTEKFEDKEKLEGLVNKIKASERLSDIKYMTASA